VGKPHFLTDDYPTPEIDKRINFQNANPDSLDRAMVIESLKRQRAIALSEQSSLERRLNTATTLRRILMLMGGAFLVLMVFYFRRYRKHLQLARKLKKKERELSNALSRLNENQQEYFNQYEKIKRMIEDSSDGLWEVKPETGEISFGGSLKRVAGYEVNIRNVNDITSKENPFHPGDAVKFKKAIENCISGRHKGINVEVRVLHQSKKYWWIRLRGSLVNCDNGSSQRCIMGIVHDIHATKEAEAKTREKEQQLLDTNKAKDKFFSIIAHDLKSPFNAIVGLSDLLNHEYESFSDEEKKEFIKSIYGASDNAFQLLQNLLQWSRSQNGRIEFEPKQLELNVIVDEVIQINQPMAARKEITIRKEIPEKTNLEADRNMLSLVIHNLLSNALKFTYRNRNVSLKANVQGNNLLFYVIDQGMGIPEENKDRLFDIDSDYKTRGTEKEKGTGLGLTLCKEFVNRHHGDIWVESKEDQGSLFGFRIPLKQPKV
jgi:PAS domain S-box-containing protein